MAPGTFWSFPLLAFVLLFPFQPKFVAQAEISSLRTNDRFHRLGLRRQPARVPRQTPDVEVAPSADDAKVFNGFQTVPQGAWKPNNGTKLGNETGNGLGHEAPIGIKAAPNHSTRPQIPGEKYKSGSEDEPRRPASIRMSDNTYVPKKEVKRSVTTTHGGAVDRSGEAQSRERFVETVQGVPNSRAEYRRTAEDARGSNPRQSEPHLDTNTFALSGDSAHNQAMVHWSGHNSSRRQRIGHGWGNGFLSSKTQKIQTAAP